MLPKKVFAPFTITRPPEPFNKIELIEGKKVPLSLILDTNSPLLERKIKSPTKPELSEFVPKFTTVPASI